MANRNTDVISSQTLATGQHYYSSGSYLREKHRLAGDQYVRWALDLIPNGSSARILDAGGGWGRYLWQLIDHYAVDAHNVVLMDLSVGMLHTAFEEAHQRTIRLKAAACNIETLPFPDQHFDIVLANKVLYHLQDIPRGIRELARIIKPGGVLLATTNSDKIVATLIALHYEALQTLNIAFVPEAPSPFSMENGGALLAEQFETVEQHYYSDETLIENAAEIRAAYETIGRYRNLLARDDIAEATKQALPAVVEQLAQTIIDRDGVLKSPALMGAFVCRRAGFAST